MEFIRKLIWCSALYFHVCFANNGPEPHGRLVLDLSQNHMPVFFRFFNLTLGQRVDISGYLECYEVHPVLVGTESQVVAKIARADNAKYVSRNAELLSKLNQTLQQETDERNLASKPTSSRRGFVRFLQYFEKAEIQMPDGELLKDRSVVFTGLVNDRLSSEYTELKLQRMSIENVAENIRFLILGMVTCIREVILKKIISNRFHPSLLGFKKYTSKGRNQMYRVVCTDFSFGSDLLRLEERLYMKPNFNDSGLDFPIQWIGDEIEVLDLYSKKGGFRSEMNENVSLVYSVLLLVDELPFYTKNIIKVLMQTDVRPEFGPNYHLIGICEIVRVHLTLVRNELRGDFEKLFRHYRKNTKYWELLGMNKAIKPTNTLFSENKATASRKRDMGRMM